jgi:hypothetical protein
MSYLVAAQTCHFGLRPTFAQEGILFKVICAFDVITSLVSLVYWGVPR